MLIGRHPERDDVRGGRGSRLKRVTALDQVPTSLGGALPGPGERDIASRAEPHLADPAGVSEHEHLPTSAVGAHR